MIKITFDVSYRSIPTVKCAQRQFWTTLNWFPIRTPPQETRTVDASLVALSCFCALPHIQSATPTTSSLYRKSSVILQHAAMTFCKVPLLCSEWQRKNKRHWRARWESTANASDVGVPLYSIKKASNSCRSFIFTKTTAAVLPNQEEKAPFALAVALDWFQLKLPVLKVSVIRNIT